MKSTTRLALTVAALLGSTHLARAAAKVHEDGSQLAIYIFLGICALIIVVQLFPVFFMFYGLVKGLLQGKKEAEKVPAEIVNDK